MVYLENNLIEDITVNDLELIRSECVIVLAHNRITRVSASTFNYMMDYHNEFKGGIILSDNPFDCSCEAVPFM